MEDELFEPVLSSSFHGAHCVPSLVHESDYAFRVAPWQPPARRHALLAGQDFHKGSVRERCRALYRPSRSLVSEGIAVSTEDEQACGRRALAYAVSGANEGETSEADRGPAAAFADGAFGAPIRLRDPEDPYGRGAGSQPCPAVSPARLQFAKRSAAPASAHQFYVPRAAPQPPSWHGLPGSYHGARSSYSATFIQSYHVDRECRCHDGCINSIHTDSHGEFLLTGSDDLCLCLHRTDTWDQVWKMQTEHRANIFSAVFLPHQSCSKILSCGLDGQTLLMDVESQHTTTMASFSSMASSIVFPAATPTTAFVAYSDGHIVRADTRCSPITSTSGAGTSHIAANLVLGNPCAGFVSHVHALAVHDRHPYAIASATDSSFVFLHDIRMGSTRAYAAMGLGRLRSGAPHDVDDGIGGLSFSQRGDWLAVNYRGDDVYLLPWEHELYGGPLRSSSCYAFPDDTAGGHDETLVGVASSSAEAEAKYVLAMESSDARSIPLILSRHYIALRGRRNSTTMFKEVAWMADDTVVATGSDDGLVYFWSTESGKLLHQTRGDDDVVNGVLHHPGSGQLITCGIDSSFKVLRPDAQFLAQAPATTAAWVVVRQAERADVVQPAPQTQTPAADGQPAAPPTARDARRREGAEQVPFSATHVFESLIMPFIAPLVVSDSPSDGGSRSGAAGPSPLSSMTPSPAPVPTTRVAEASSAGSPPSLARAAQHVDVAPPPQLSPRDDTANTRLERADSGWTTLASEPALSGDSLGSLTTTTTASSSRASSMERAAATNPFLAPPPRRGGGSQPDSRLPHVPLLHAPPVSQLRQRVLEKVCELQGTTLRTVTMNTTTSQLREVLTRVQRCRADAEVFQSSLMEWSWSEGEEDSDDGDEWEDDNGNESDRDDAGGVYPDVLGAGGASGRPDASREAARASRQPVARSPDHGGAQAAASDSHSEEWEDVRNASSASMHSSASSSSSTSASSGDWEGLLAPVEMLMGLTEAVSRRRHRWQRYSPQAAASSGSSETTGHQPARGASAAVADGDDDDNTGEALERHIRATEVLSSTAHIHKILVHHMCAWSYFDPVHTVKRRVQYCVWHRSLLDRGNPSYHHTAQTDTAAPHQRTSAPAAEAVTSPGLVGRTFYDWLTRFHDDAESLYALPAPQRPSVTSPTAASQEPSSRSASSESSHSASSASSPAGSPRGAGQVPDTVSPSALMHSMRLLTAEFSICAVKVAHLLQLESIYLQGKEGLFDTPALRHQYWTKRASLQMQWIYYYMAVGDLNGVRRHTDELDQWWEYASIVALGSASPSFLAAHAQELASGVVRLPSSAAGGHRQKKTSRRPDVVEGDATPPSRKRMRGAGPAADEPRTEEESDSGTDTHTTAATTSTGHPAKPRLLLVNNQSWRYVPAIHGANGAQLDGHRGGDDTEKMNDSSKGVWLPKLLVPLALRYRAVSQRLKNPGVMLLDCPRLTPGDYAQQQAELLEERQRVRDELERRIVHHPHVKMVKKVRALFAESVFYD